MKKTMRKMLEKDKKVRGKKENEWKRLERERKKGEEIKKKW